MTKVSLYPPRVLRFRGKDKVDGTIDDGGGGYNSKSLSGELLENVLAEYIDLDCSPAQEGEVQMTLVVDTGVKMFPKYVSFENTAGGKGLEDCVFKIGSTTGGSDVMPSTQMHGAFLDHSTPIALEGVLPSLSSTTSTFFLTLEVASGSVSEYSIRIHGHQRDE